MSSPNALGVKVRKRKLKSGVSTDGPRNARNVLRKRKQDLLRRINYTSVVSVVLLPLGAMIYMIHENKGIIPENVKTLWFSIFYFNLTILAFSSGYHKCYAHSTFRPKHAFMHLFFSIFGASLGMGPVRTWASMHRAHHQYTDDPEKDPYSIKRGLLWAHWGWLLKKPKTTKFYRDFVEHEFPLSSGSTSPGLSEETTFMKTSIESGVIEGGVTEGGVIESGVIESGVVEGGVIEGGSTENGSTENRSTEIGTTEIDLDFENTDDESAQVNSQRTDNILNILAWVLWQEKWYFYLFLITSLIIPMLVSVHICKDSWVNGLIYPGILRMFMCQQSMLSTESVCHSKSLGVSIPSQPFNDKNSSVNCANPLVVLLTYGQASQNYHHEFPHDYRVSSSRWTFDPTKWFIYVLSQLRLVDDVAKAPRSLVTQLRIQQQQHVLNRLKSQLNWGTPISKLPMISTKDFKKLCVSTSSQNRIYIVVQNIIHDITPFMDQHPGGLALLKASHGKDATKAFFGGVYGHSTAAVNLLATMRIGVLDVGNDEDVWRRVVREEGENGDDSSRRNGQYKSAEAA